MNASTLCLGDNDVGPLLAGDLESARASRLEQHLTTCVECREKLERQVGDKAWWSKTVASLRQDGPRQRSTGNEVEAPQPLLDLLGPTDDPNMLGRIGSFEIVGLLGQGGMGAVFKGFDCSLNRYVAIKVLLPHLAASGAARQRFAREGQAVAAVVDDHVMAVHCVDEWQGIPYIVMTYSRGVTLQKRLQNNGPLEVREILRIGMQAATGLAAAHAQGIVHRDVKPANLFLDESVERVQLMDFGLARALDDASLTRSGMFAGTPQYMSPEQAKAEVVDHRTDLFSLGSVLYALCVGHAPFRADTCYGVMRLIIDKEPQPIRDLNAEIPEWLCAIIEKLMSKQTCNRFESAREVAEILEGCLAHAQQPTTTPLPDSVAAMPPRRGSRPPWTKYLAAGAVAFGLVFATVLIYLEYGKATLRIECAADDVPIRIMQGADVVKNLIVTRKAESVRVAAGNYVVVIDGETDGLELNNGVVSLDRGGIKTVHIVRTDTSRPNTAEQPLSVEGGTEDNLEESADANSRLREAELELNVATYEYRTAKATAMNSLQVKSAEAAYEVAKAELDEAQGANEKVPGSLSEQGILRLTHSATSAAIKVELARATLKDAARRALAKFAVYELAKHRRDQLKSAIENASDDSPSLMEGFQGRLRLDE